MLGKITQWIFENENVSKLKFQGHLKVAYFGEVRTVRYRVRQHDKRILLCVQDFKLAEVSHTGRQRSQAVVPDSKRLQPPEIPRLRW